VEKILVQGMESIL